MYYKIADRLPELIAAGLTILIGVFALVESDNYDMGVLSNMGPGYFPRMMAIGMMLLGLILGLSALKTGPVYFAATGASLWATLVVCASLISFALLIERLGIIPAIFAMVFLSTFASRDRNLTRSLVLAAATSVFCALLFVYVLGLSMKVIVL